jgi:hypothetical protein
MSGISDRNPHDNPYRAPESELIPQIEQMSGFLGQESKSEIDLRHHYLPAEATVRTIGLIQLLMVAVSLISIGLILFANAFAGMIETQAATSKLDPIVMRNGMVFFKVLGMSIALVLGLGLRELKNWARWTIIVFNTVGLLARIPVYLNPTLMRWAVVPVAESIVSTGFAIALVVLLLLPGSGFVCSKHYRFVVSETREIRPKLSVRDKILLGAFLLNCVLGVASGFF